MGCPPLSIGADQVREIDVAVLPAKMTSVGAAGMVAGVALVVVEFVLVPSTVVCATRN